MAVPALAGANSLGGSGNNQFTVEAWIYPSQLVGADAIYTVNQWNTGVVHFLVNGSSIRFTVANSVNANGSQHDANFPSSGAIGTGQWAYVAVVYDDTIPSAILYIDGKPVNTNFYSTTYAISLDVGAIGVQTDGGDPPFAGLIDEFAIYTNALSASRIQTHYTAAFVQPCRPTLSIVKSDSQLTIGWNTTGFILQETSNLLNATFWVDVPVATNSPVTVPINNTSMFYRLRNQ